MSGTRTLKPNAILLIMLAFFGVLGSAAPGISSKSTNWAGYKVKFPDFSGQKVDRVSASWIVPNVQPSVQLRQVSEWIGIGYVQNDLVQIGTLQTAVNGRVRYTAWYQRLPEDLESVSINELDGKVGPGTAINAVVEKSAGDSWVLTIIAGNTRFQRKVVHLGSQQLSAEWILELPTLVKSRRTASLANFGNVTFTGARATVDGDESIVKDLPYTIDELVDSPYTTVLASTGDLLEDGESFVVTYKAPDDSTADVGAFIISGAPYIGLASLVSGGAVATTVYAKRFKRRREKQ